MGNTRGEVTGAVVRGTGGEAIVSKILQLLALGGLQKRE
jgi:hypothetical protein